MGSPMKNSDFFPLSDADREFLEREWAEVTVELPEPLALEARSNLFKAYSEKHRAYHNLGHIAALLRHCAQHRAALEDARAVRFAVWFHDCVYRPSRKDNETESARIAELYLAALGVDEPTRQAVAAMILATQRHDGTGATPDAKYFLDFDLAILGTRPETYYTYQQAIRREYRLVPGFLYRPGRKKILTAFLERERLYFTDAFYATHEAAARNNLRVEIETL
jgi:predicted metal-dependent HD superfamily phosphohydrolase